MLHVICKYYTGVEYFYFIHNVLLTLTIRQEHINVVEIIARESRTDLFLRF